MDTFCIQNVSIFSPCTFKCPIKITRQSSNSCDAGSHRYAYETTARLNCPETRWRTLCRSVCRTSTSLHDVLGSKETYLSLHNPKYETASGTDLRSASVQNFSQIRSAVLDMHPKETNTQTDTQTAKLISHYYGETISRFRTEYLL